MLTLLLTATINPGDMILLKRRDPYKRLNDYLSALRRWVRVHGIDNIVFCENSGSHEIQSIVDIAQRTNPPVEVLQFCGNDYPLELGKGYGEATIINYALSHSEYIERADYVIKCTGRLFVINSNRTLQCLRSSPDIAVNLDRTLQKADSRFFVVRPSVLRQVMDGFEQQVNDSRGITFENVLANRVLGLIASGVRWSSLAELPLYSGVCGGSNRRYDSGVYLAYQIAKWGVQKIARSLKVEI